MIIAIVEIIIYSNGIILVDKLTIIAKQRKIFFIFNVM